MENYRELTPWNSGLILSLQGGEKYFILWKIHSEKLIRWELDPNGHTRELIWNVILFNFVEQ